MRRRRRRRGCGRQARSAAPQGGPQPPPPLQTTCARRLRSTSPLSSSRWPRPASSARAGLLRPLALLPPRLLQRERGPADLALAPPPCRYAEAHRRHNYTTPKSYLEFIAAYKALLARKRAELLAAKERLESGVEKIAQARWARAAAWRGGRRAGPLRLGCEATAPLPAPPPAQPGGGGAAEEPAGGAGHRGGEEGPHPGARGRGAPLAPHCW